MRDLLDFDIFTDKDMCPLKKEDNCQCLEDLPLAYSYVPYQRFEEPYSKQKALERGTAYASLDKPYGVYGNEFKVRGVYDL